MKEELGSRDEGDERRCGEESRRMSGEFKRGVSQLAMKNTSLTGLLVTQSLSDTHKTKRNVLTRLREPVQRGETEKLRIMDIMSEYSKTSYSLSFTLKCNIVPV